MQTVSRVDIEPDKLARYAAHKDSQDDPPSPYGVNLMRIQPDSMVKPPPAWQISNNYDDRAVVTLRNGRERVIR